MPAGPARWARDSGGLAGGGVDVVGTKLQLIVEIASGRVVAHEALSRFADALGEVAALRVAYERRVGAMSSSGTDVSRLKSRRLVLIVVAAVVVLAVAAAVVVTFVLRPATGVRAALEDESFTSCLGREGRPEDEPSTVGAESFDEDEEVEFWSHPLALHCSTIALNEDRRTRALSIAFPSLEGDRSGDVDDQWQPITEYAVWLEADDVPRDVAMLRIASVLRAL